MKSNQNSRDLDLIGLQQKLDALQNSLQNHLTATDIFNPIARKKEELILKLNNIIQELHTKIPDEEITANIIKKIDEIIPLIGTLNLTTEKDLKEHIAKLDKLIKKFNKQKAIEERITRLNYGVNLFTIMNYLATGAKGVMTCFFAWSMGISKALERVSPIFYPINASFIAATMFINFLISMFKLVRTKHEVEEAGIFAKQEMRDAKSLLKKSTAFQFFIFTFQVLAVLGFAGVLTTPLGWVFIAAATLVGWINETFVEVRKAEAKRDKYPEGSPEYLLEQAEVNKQKNEAAWKSINVLSAILVACAPIPGIGPLLGLIGLGLLAINPVREGLTYLYNKFSKENKSTPESQPESEFQSAANDPTYSTSAGMQAALSNARKTEPSRQPTREITPVETLSEPEPKQSLAQRFWSFWSSSTAELPQSQESQKQNNRQGENNQKIR